MIESINDQTGRGATLLRTAQTALAEIPQIWHPANHNATTNLNLTSPQSSRRPVEIDRYPWLFERLTIAVEPQWWTTDVQISPSESLLLANPRLASLVTAAIGDRWIAHLEDLQQLGSLADDPGFQSRWRGVKRANKQALANDIEQAQGVKIDVDSLFDIQLQPICGYQRQLLNILHIISNFNRLKDNPALDILPRTWIFSHVGELEPDREILTLIESLAKILAVDADVRGRLQVVYVPQSAEWSDRLYAAADLTEQIATAKMEDVNLSKLKFAINGALSIGSLGKANHLVQQAVSAENFFSFGLAIPEILLFRKYGYDPYNYYKYYPQIRQAIDCLLTGRLTPADSGACRSLIDEVLSTDEHMVLADYVCYLACQTHVSQIYRQKSVWTRMAILNVSGVG
jgi:glycogen phosphorylase